MAPLSARPCSPPAGTTTASRDAAPRGRSKGGQPILTGPTIFPSARWTGSRGRRAVPKARSRPCGGSMSIGKASRLPVSASASRTAVPGTPGLSAPGPRTPGVVSISRRRSTVKRCKRREPGMSVRRGGNATKVVRESKGPCRKACGPSASAAPASGVERQHVYSTWPSPPRSIAIGLLPGWRSGHGPRRGPRAWRHWRLCMPCPRRPPPSAPRPYSSARLMRSRQAASCYFLLQKLLL
jgi:hypothetical protein